MDYTIKELTDGNAVVVFADDSWANVSVMTNDTKATFEERVQGYAPKATVPNPSSVAVRFVILAGAVFKLLLFSALYKIDLA